MRSPGRRRISATASSRGSDASWLPPCQAHTQILFAARCFRRISPPHSGAWCWRAVAWLPRSLIADDLAQGRLIPAGPPMFDIDVGINLFRASHGLGKTAERFWALARNEAGQREG